MSAVIRAIFLSFVGVLTLVCALGLEGCGARSADASTPGIPDAVLARGTVDVVGGLLPVMPRRNGHVSVVLGSLGETVAQGAILAKLSDGPELAETDIARADLQRARAELAAKKSRLAMLEEQFARVREAEKAGAESGRVLDDLRLQLESQRSEIPIAEAALAGAAARLRGALQAAEGSTIRAPAAGRIVQVSTRVGALVSETEATPLFLLRPETALIVRATVAARDAERIAPGMAVSIEPADGDGRSYVGRVREVGELARKPDPTLAADDFASDRAVDCVIDAGAAPLRIGSLVVVRFGAGEGSGGRSPAAPPRSGQ